MEYVIISAAIAMAICLFVIVLCVTRPKRRVDVFAPEEAAEHAEKFKLILRSALDKKRKTHIEMALSDYVNFVKDNSNSLVFDQELVDEAKNYINLYTQSKSALKKEHAKLINDLKRALDKGVRKNVQDAFQTLKAFEDYNCVVVQPQKKLLLQADVFMRRQRSIKESMAPTERVLSQRLRYAISSEKSMIVQATLIEYEDFVKEHKHSTPDNQLIADAKDFLAKQGEEFLELKQELEELVMHLEKMLESGHLQDTERALIRYNLFFKLHEGKLVYKDKLVERAEAMIRERQQQANNRRVQHNVLHENLRSAVAYHDPENLREALHLYEEFMATNAGLFNADDELVAVAKNCVHTWADEMFEMAAKEAKEAREHVQTIVTTRQSIREPVGIEVVQKLDERKKKLNEAVGMRDLSAIQKSMKKYEEFIQKYTPAIIADKNLIAESRKLAEQLENRKVLVEAIEEKNEKKLKEVLLKIEDPSFDRTTVPEYVTGKRLNEDLEYSDNLKQVILKFNKGALSKVIDIEDPPNHLVDTMRASLLILGDAEIETSDWESCKKRLSTVNTQDYEDIFRRVKRFKHKNLHPEIAARANEMLDMHSKKKFESTGAAAFAFYFWAQSVCELCLKRCTELPTAATGDRQVECIQQSKGKESVTKQISACTAE